MVGPKGASMVGPKGRQYYPAWLQHCPASLADNEELISSIRGRKGSILGGWVGVRLLLRVETTPSGEINP